MEYEVIDLIATGRGSFIVEIEHTKDRKREKFGYPLGEGWQEELADGRPKFLNDIDRKLTEREMNRTAGKGFEKIAFKWKGTKHKQEKR